VDWTRVTLSPGQTQTVTTTLAPNSPERPLSFWHAGVAQWQIASGVYRAYAGASSRDLPLAADFRVNVSGWH